MRKSNGFGLDRPMRYGIQWPMFNLNWADGATEEIQTEDSSNKSTELFSVDDIELDKEVEGDEKEEKSDELELEIEDATKVTKESTEFADLRKQIAELQRDLLQATKPKPTLEKKEEKEEELTDAQLEAILKEHKDNPGVWINVQKYIAEREAKKTRDATMKDVNHRQWHSNLSGMANRIISEDEDGYLAANPKVAESLESYAANLGMGNHPIGPLAAYAILRLSETIKATKDKAGKVAETKTATTTDPNKGKMDKTRTTQSKQKNAGLTQEHLDMAKKFGVKPETYARFVGRK